MENNVYYFLQFRSNTEFRRKGSYDFNSVKFIFINLKLYIT